MITQDNEVEQDPFLCSCGPCKRFWKETFGEGAKLITQPSLLRASTTAVVSPNSNVVKIGDRVSIPGQLLAKHCALQTEVQSRKKNAQDSSDRSDIYFKGTVKYIGFIDDATVAPELYVGVKLDDQVNSVHNGVFNGRRYFHCARGHGAVLKYKDVIPIKHPMSRPQISGNPMFPSYEQVKKQRKERNAILQATYNSAGLKGPQYTEPYVSQRSFPPVIIRSSPASAGSNRPRKIEPIIHIGDPNDIALQDLRRKKDTETKRKMTSREDYEKKEMDRLRLYFAGRPDADILAQTLKKLQIAYQEGKKLNKRETMDRTKDSEENEIRDS
ncbi:hypothetical protein CHS0354_031049 [Potamilus streckersoni]|uniref:CAP-Gly domain-containing protein n=1 Tax=Potamilus streckersoni TaxID=2493646 RepID=A0AAE0TCW0_9BIVA|nr:hypothetical protein CHS0354_031049 [Potamilus streckersoni]